MKCINNVTFFTVQELKFHNHNGFMRAYVNWNHATKKSLQEFIDTCTDHYSFNGIPEYLHTDLTKGIS